MKIYGDEMTDAQFKAPFPNKRLPYDQNCIDRFENHGFEDQICACLIDISDYPHFCRWWWNEWTLNKYNCLHEHEYTKTDEIECNHIMKQGEGQMADMLWHEL